MLRREAVGAGRWGREAGVGGCGPCVALALSAGHGFFAGLRVWGCWASRERVGPRVSKGGGSGSGRAQVCAAGLCEGVGGGLGRGEERERVGRRVGLAGVW